MGLLKILHNLLPPSARNYVMFVYKMRYFPDFSRPVTFNEKINHRKKNYTRKESPLFSICADKLAAKKYVGEVVGDDYVIETLYSGEGVDKSKIVDLLGANDGIVAKANHNSGPVFILDQNSSSEEIEKSVASLNRQLEEDYGKAKIEPWYSEIRPMVLIEKKLEPNDGESEVVDYKFHVFKREIGLDPTIILQVDYDRFSNHNRSFFDEELRWLPFSMKYPSVKTSLQKPSNFESMVSVAKKLAEPFSYVRIDLYNARDKIYFGEMTFAHESGLGPFSSKGHDSWMGSLWHIDDCSFYRHSNSGR